MFPPSSTGVPAMLPFAVLQRQARGNSQNNSLPNLRPQQGDTSKRKKPHVDLVLTVLAAGGLLLELPTAQAG